MKKLLLLAILSVAANSFARIEHTEPYTEQGLADYHREQDRLKDIRDQKDANGNSKVKVHKIDKDSYMRRFTKVTPPVK